MSIEQPKIIRAQVSNDILQKVGVLFDNKPETVLAEVLQNCRRAGATQVKIDCRSVDNKPKSYNLVIEDNGSGIADFQSLLTLGGSGWDEDVKENEVPAGMGFFSLCAISDGVTVFSGSSKAFFDARSFHGKADVQVDASGEYVEGTRLVFQLNTEWRGYAWVDSTEVSKLQVPSLLWNLLRFYPVAVMFNGTLLPREDFLKDAAHVTNAEGLRIGVYDRRPEMPKSDWHAAYYFPEMVKAGSGTINFHGLVIHKQTTTYTRFPVFVDVTNTRSLDLVLPSRDKVVENEKWKALQLEIENALFRYLVESNVWHVLPFSVYEIAHARGFDIGEAEARLSQPVLNRIHADGSCDWVSEDELLDAEWYELDEESVLCDLPQSSLAGLVLANRLGQGLGLKLVKPDDRMAGYSWYPKRELLSVLQVLTNTDGVEAVHSFSDDEKDPEDPDPVGYHMPEERPAKIELELTFREEGKEDEVVRVPTWCAFDTTDYGEDGRWVVSQEHFGTVRMDSTTLADLFFKEHDDDSTSESDQESEFLICAEAAITRLYDNAETARVQQVEAMINSWKLQSLLRENKIQGIALDVEENGLVKVKEFQFRNANERAE